MKYRLAKFSSLLLTLLFSIHLSAAHFHNPSISYLYGDNFKVEAEKQQAITFEYATAWDYFDLFMFVDFKDYSPSGSGRYGEFSPRLKLYEFDKTSLLKKITFASTFERGKNDVETNLFGIGLDFNSTHFKYLTANFYRRDDSNKDGHGWQLTTTWNYSNQIFNLPITIDGYIDWVFSSNEINENFHFNPQIKLDMKKLLGGSKQWFVGVEYDYWQNKYGIKDSPSFHSNQNTFSLLAKVHF